MDSENYGNAAETSAPFLQTFYNSLPPVRLKNSEEIASADAVRAYVEMAFGGKKYTPALNMQATAQTFNRSDLEVLAKKLYYAWRKAPQAQLRQGVFMLYGMHGNDADMADLWRDIMVWLQLDKNYRALAFDGVMALSFNRGQLAPMLLEHIGRHTDNENVYIAARDALATLVNYLDITWDELGDYIVPGLGFNDNGEFEIAAGSGSYTAVIMPDMTLALRNAEGAEIEALPEPVEDLAPPLPENLDLDVPDDGYEELDMDAVAALNQSSAVMPRQNRPSSGASLNKTTAGAALDPALKRFYDLQKSFAAVVEIQSDRLRLFMLAGHNMDKEIWRRLFIYNPILRRFSQTLVWGVYKYHMLYDSFICRANGGFTRADGSPFDFEAIEDEARVNPAHPLEMPPDLLAAWRARLAADGIVQPVRQMGYEFTGSHAEMEEEFDFIDELSEYDAHLLKGFDISDGSDDNIYHLEYLGYLLGVEGKELFMAVYCNGHANLKERSLYSLSCEAGDPEMDAIVCRILLTPSHIFYPRLIQALERHKNDRWLDLLRNHLYYCIKNRVANVPGARGLLHAGLTEYYDVAKETFVLHWEENWFTDMGIYAFEADAARAVNDILPYVLNIGVEDKEKAKLISLPSMVQAAYRNLGQSEFYDAFLPVFNNPATRNGLVDAFMARIKYDWNKRDLMVELQRDVPVKQLLKLDYRWYVPFLREGLVDFVVHSVTKEMPMAPLMDIFKSLVERDFENFEDLENFYKYALGMLALGNKDFMHDLLLRVKELMPQRPYKRETLQRLAYYMEREATAFGDEFWIQQFILLDPLGFAGVFEAMLEQADDKNKTLLQRILTAIYVIAYNK